MLLERFYQVPSLLSPEAPRGTCHNGLLQGPVQLVAFPANPSVAPKAHAGHGRAEEPRAPPHATLTTPLGHRCRNWPISRFRKSTTSSKPPPRPSADMPTPRMASAGAETSRPPAMTALAFWNIPWPKAYETIEHGFKWLQNGLGQALLGRLQLLKCRDPMRLADLSAGLTHFAVCRAFKSPNTKVEQRTCFPDFRSSQSEKKR